MRERDITELRPTEMRRAESDSYVRIYRLDDNRQITVRPSTTFRDTPFPTMDMQQRIVRPGRRDEWITIHKIRSRLND